MSEITPIQSPPGAQAPPPTGSASNYEKNTLAALLAILNALWGGIDNYYYPALQRAQLLNDAGQSILALLTLGPDSIHDPTLTQFMNGWAYLVELDKLHLLPNQMKLFMDNKDFKQLFSTLVDMNNIEKQHPNSYKKNKQWIADYNAIHGTNVHGFITMGLLAKIEGLPEKYKDFAQAFAQLSGSTVMTVYQQCLLELKITESVVKLTTTFLKRDIQLIQNVIGRIQS